MKMKLLTTAVMAVGLATGGALAQSKNASGPNFMSDEERVMYEDNAEVMGGFFTDETMAELRTDEEIETAFGAMGDDDRAEVVAACDRAMQNRGSYGPVTVSLCEKVGAL
ncbi:hypothetical protein N1F89_02830 [Aquibium sp. A9E412]|uniref:hypothetical protein n=1 Tax=Aquibium sp. A9E412 TaxID=2976767 RepID=UPI0025B1E722|nr:hypothetical protein [Aquibium sp. A9E412]MDN2565145.1 hypothetical protein [Aquibium sp. A9E412]